MNNILPRSKVCNSCYRRNGSPDRLIRIIVIALPTSDKH